MAWTNMMAKEVVGVKFCTLFEDRNKNDYFLNPINTKVIPPLFFFFALLHKSPSTPRQTPVHPSGLS